MLFGQINLHMRNALAPFMRKSQRFLARSAKTTTLSTRGKIMTTLDLSEERATSEVWPSLPLAAWQDTYQTLHMWTQIVGKVRLGLSPPVNHWWAVTLY